MASTYQGDPTATQAPSATPGIGVYPTGNLPADGDTLNASAFNQAYKALLDYSAFAQYHLWTGVSRYSATASYNYGYLVLWAVADGGDGKLYKCIFAGTGNAPSNTTYWERCGYAGSELGGTVSSAYITPDIGSVANVLVTYAGPVKDLMFTLTMPLTDGAATATITLTSSAAFATAAQNCQVTIKAASAYTRLTGNVAGPNEIHVSAAVALASTVDIYVRVSGT